MSITTTAFTDMFKKISPPSTFVLDRIEINSKIGITAMSWKSRTPSAFFP